MKKPAPYVTINGQSVPWWFIQRIRAMMGGDWPQTINAFYLAKNSTNIIKYVSKGMVPNEKGIKYSFMPCKEWEDGKWYIVQDWWDTIHKPTPGKKGDCVSYIDALKESLKGLI
jgi:hypothetical protein